MRSAVVLALTLLLLITESSSSAAGAYPFSYLVDWEEKASRQDYESLLKNAGITVKKIAMNPRPLAEPLAEREECLFLEKNGVLVGYGIAFENFYAPVVSENRAKGDVREITILKAEVLYDRDGRHIFLASYRFRLSPVEMFIAKWVMRQEPEAERKIFFIDRPLGQGYELAESSWKLVGLLLVLPKGCLTQQG